jgi:hypothetical protein
MSTDTKAPVPAPATAAAAADKAGDHSDASVAEGEFDNCLKRDDRKLTVKRRTQTLHREPRLCDHRG